MVMFEILALQMPYSGMNDAQIADCMRENKRPELPAIIANDPAYAGLIELHHKCISFNPYVVLDDCYYIIVVVVWSCVFNVRFRLERPDAGQVKEALVSLRS